MDIKRTNSAVIYIHNTITYYFHDLISTLQKQHLNTKFSTPHATCLYQMFMYLTLFPLYYKHLVTFTYYYYC